METQKATAATISMRILVIPRTVSQSILEREDCVGVREDCTGAWEDCTRESNTFCSPLTQLIHALAARDISASTRVLYSFISFVETFWTVIVPSQSK